MTEIYNPFRTALKRTSLCKPLDILVNKGFITETDKILDYGCGRGGDVKRLSADPFNYNIQGYDSYSPEYCEGDDLLMGEYDIITCNYMFNVMPDLRLHRVTLEALLSMCREAYITVRSDEKAVKDSWVYSPTHGGYWTSTGTFQRFYDEEMVKELFGDVEFVVSNSSMRLFKINGYLQQRNNKNH